MATATFGAGCFWGVEEAFRTLDGVSSTEVGYCGGDTEEPSYEDVCTGRTNHAEVVRIEFDPKVISYDQLMEVFWSSHDPTTINRQGPDVGTQYRSVIFTHDDEQKELATKQIDALTKQGRWSNPIVTQVVEAGRFWKAEEYHQQYLHKRGMGSCHL